MGRLIVVSNRVADLDKPQSASSGGLAMAMAGALREEGGIWLGWSGNSGTENLARPALSEIDGITIARLDLSDREIDEYYNGFANRTLWPLFHYRNDLAAYEQSFRETYTDVNRRFAAALRDLIEPDDVIWVQDYHLIPLGRELRAMGFTNRIGFFLHIPWPAREIFITLPQHAELVWSMFAYDLIGFQSRGSLRAFIDYVSTDLNAVPSPDGAIDHFGRSLTARSYPIGIDPREMASLALTDEGMESYEQLKRVHRGRKLLLGVDRIDYSKGLPHKFAAYSRFLESSPELHGKTGFLQIGQPSRSRVQEYQDLSEHLIAEAGRINGRHGRLDWTPLHYHTQSYGRAALAGIYRAADVCLVTPLRDGMNLVAKEFIAAQDPDDPGVLILSQFAGAAEQLEDALIVNPYSDDQCAAAILRATQMPLDERKARWRKLMDNVCDESLTAWKDRFLSDLRGDDADGAAQPYRRRA